MVQLLAIQWFHGVNILKENEILMILLMLLNNFDFFILI